MYLLGEGVEKDPETAKNLMRFIEEEEKKAKKGEASSFPVCSTNTPTKDSCGTAPHDSTDCAPALRIGTPQIARSRLHLPLNPPAAVGLELVALQSAPAPAIEALQQVGDGAAHAMRTLLGNRGFATQTAKTEH